MNETTLLQPVSAGERIEAMDVLRGFALLGILLMNIEAMAGPLFAATSGANQSLQGADALVDALVYILVQGKFYTLFSLLFGMGFAVMMERATRAGRPFARLYLRRTLGLLAIGLGHSILIWSGDVLVGYALMSLPLLLLFRRAPQRALPWWAMALYLVPVGLMVLFALLGVLAQQDPTASAQMGKAMEQQAAEMAATIDAQRHAYGAGSFGEATARRAADTLTMLGVLPFFGFHVLGMFVLGSWFVRSGVIARPHEFAGLYSRLRWLAFPAGLALMLASWAIEPEMAHDRMDIPMAAAFALHAVGSLLMCLGYVGWIVGALHSRSTARLLGLLAPAGRMALTNYLMQSLVCTLVFYHYGLDYFERMPRAWQPLFAIALFAAQVVFSRWWLSRHSHGPMERLWRAWTYRGQRAGEAPVTPIA